MKIELQTIPSFQYCSITKLSKHTKFSCIYLNIRSLKKNFSTFIAEIQNYLNLVDLIVLVETNINDEEQNFFKITSFNCEFLNRKNRRGGGIAIYINEKHVYDIIKPAKSTFESMIVQIKSSQNPILLLAIYRPPCTLNSDPFTKELDSTLLQHARNRNFILVGDINLDINKRNKYSNFYLDTLYTNGMLNCNSSEKTREDLKRKCGSNIDHLFIRYRHEPDILVELVENQIADHKAIFFAIDSPNIDIAMKKPEEMSQICIKKVNLLIKSIVWDTQDIEDDQPDSILNKIIANFHNVYENAQKRYKKPRQKHAPWFDSRLDVMCKQRDRLFKKWKAKIHDATLEADYKSYRNMVSKAITNSKNEYFREKLQGCSNDTKKTWAVINEIMGKKCENLDDALKKNFKSTDDETLANMFADDFKSNIDETVHICKHKTMSHEVLNSQVNSCFIEQTDEMEVLNILRKINGSKGPGIDKIRPKDLKNHAFELTQVITKLINACIVHGEIPNLLKTAMVRPIFKKGTKNNTNNYRPISILPAIEKILEEVLCRRVTKFLDKNNIIDCRQYGFQKGKSVNQLLGKFASLVNQNLSKSEHCAVLFIDFTKAFDTIPHDKLLSSLEKVGIRGNCLKLFNSYLQSRKFAVRINDKVSKLQDVSFGVPQGSILGPLLFLIYSDGLLKNIKTENIYAYADDIAIVVSHRTIDGMKRKIQRDLNDISKWCHDYGLVLNANKTKLLYFRPPHKPMISISLKFNNFCPLAKTKSVTTIEQVRKFKYLGVIVDEHLKWGDHVSYIQGKLRQTAYALNHLRFCSNKSVLKCVYLSLAETHLRYGLTAWGTARRSSYIQRTQNRLIRILKKAGITDMFLPIHELYKMVTINNFYCCTEYRIEIDHVHFTRMKAAGRLKTRKFYNTYGKYTLPYIVPKLLNELPKELTSVDGVARRKAMLKKYFKGRPQ